MCLWAQLDGKTHRLVFLDPAADALLVDVVLPRIRAAGENLSRCAKVSIASIDVPQYAPSTRALDGGDGSVVSEANVMAITPLAVPGAALASSQQRRNQDGSDGPIGNNRDGGMHADDERDDGADNNGNSAEERRRVRNSPQPVASERFAKPKPRVCN